MPNTQTITKEGLEYAQFIIPVVVSLIAVYFLFPAFDDSEIKNNINSLSDRITSVDLQKANLTQFDSEFEGIRSNQSNFSSTQVFFEGKLQGFLNRIIPIEQNTSTNLISIADLSQRVISADGNIASLFSAISSLNASHESDITSINDALNDFRNSTYTNYTEMRDWFTSIDINQTALNSSMQVILNQQSAIQGNQTLISGNITIMQDRLDVFNATLQRICANLTGVC